MKNKNLTIFAVLFVGVLAGFLIATKFDFTNQASAVDTGYNTTIAVNSIPSYSSVHDLELATMDVAQNIGKAVVSISVEKTEKIGGPRIRRYYDGQPFGGEGAPFGDQFFDRFFDDFFGGRFPEREYTQRGLGSGVIIDKEGYILTNEHVVGNADKLKVTLSDGRELKAEIKGTDPRSDLAVIKVNAKDLPVALLGDSDELKIGQWVLAIGNPFAFALENPEPTVTLGVVSALHRTLGVNLGRDRDYSNLIQTDAAINPGNSGGPLVNLNGQVVGINVAIFTTNGGYQGVGFAIPINAAKRIVSRLIEGKEIVYGWIGVNVQNIDDNLMQYFGLKNREGALVGKVTENSPAKEAGIKEGDIIINFDGKSIKNTNDLVSAVTKTEVNKEVNISLIRDTKTFNLKIKTEQRPGNDEEEIIEPEEKPSNWRGLDVRDLDEQTAQRYNIKEEQGVVVIDVDSGSSAEDAGIVQGDVILSINKKLIDNLQDYKSLTSKIKGDALVMTSRGYCIIKEKIK